MSKPWPVAGSGGICRRCLSTYQGGIDIDDGQGKGTTIDKPSRLAFYNGRIQYLDRGVSWTGLLGRDR